MCSPVHWELLLRLETAPAGDAVLTALHGAGVQASAGEYEHAIDEQRIRMTFNARVPAAAPDRLVSVLEAQPGIRRITIESLG